MAAPLTRKDLEVAAFWGEAVCLVCGTLQTEVAAGEDCQECEAPGTVPASIALNFVDSLEPAND